MNKMILPMIFVLLVTMSLCFSIACTGDATVQQAARNNDATAREEKASKTNPIDSVLERTRQAVKGLSSYQTNIKHTLRQPLLDSQTVRKGRLYYKKEAAGSKLRLDFDTLKQDDAKEQVYREQVLFDGVWLVRIDHQLKRAEYHQLAEPDTPLEPLSLAAGYLPIVGFAKIEDLKSQFDITLVEETPDKSNKSIHLRLQVKSNSRYKDDYSRIDLWLDKKLFLPAKIVAISNQDEIQELEFYSQSVKKKLNNRLFQVEIPDGFSKNVTELKKTRR